MLVAGIKPIRGGLCNLATGEAKTLLVNPTELAEQVRVNYNRVQIPGLSHLRLQYVGTGNVSIPIEFYLDRFVAREASGDEDPDILDFRNFLQALTVPVSGATGVAGGGPPRALFFWPGVLSMTCVVTNLEFRYQTFDVFGDVLIYRARTTLEEARLVRMTSSQLRSRGSQRGPT